jgi:hypothetical protein
MDMHQITSKSWLAFDIWPYAWPLDGHYHNTHMHISNIHNTLLFISSWIFAKVLAIPNMTLGLMVKGCHAFHCEKWVSFAISPSLSFISFLTPPHFCLFILYSFSSNACFGFWNHAIKKSQVPKKNIRFCKHQKVFWEEIGYDIQQCCCYIKILTHNLQHH